MGHAERSANGIWKDALALSMAPGGGSAWALALVAALVVPLAPGGLSHDTAGRSWPPPVPVPERSVVTDIAAAAHPAAATGFQWTFVAPDTGSTPGCRDGANVAYDPVLASVVMFGGGSGCGLSNGTELNDTWTFAHGRWSNITENLSVAPSPRFGAGMAYDPTLRSIVMFGGCNARGLANNETWEFDGSWQRLALGNSAGPPPLYAMGFDYDPTIGGELLFGGQNGYAGPILDSNATWEFVGGTWSRLPGPGPPAAHSPSMAFDPIVNGTLAFGGANGATGRIYNATWEFRGGRWTNITPVVGPAPRYDAAMSYLPSEGALALFGGFAQALPTAGSWGDTWTFANGSWTNRTADLLLAPPPGGGGRMVWDAVDGYGILFGGLDGTQRTNWTWVFPAGTMVPDLEVVPSRIDAGQSFELTARVTDDFGPVSFTYSGLPTDCPTSDLAEFRCWTNASGNYTPELLGTDRVHYRGSAYANVSVAPPLRIASFSGRAGAGSIALAVAAVGGTPPYTYTFTGLPAGCLSANASTLTCTGTTPGVYTLAVTVGDSVGAEVGPIDRSVDVPGASGGGSSPPPYRSSAFLFELGGIAAGVAALAVILGLVARRSRRR